MRNLLDAIWPTDDSIRTLLDLGCGDLWFTAGLPGVVQHVGVDLWQPYLDRAAAKNAPGFRPERADVLEFMPRQADNSYHAVVAIDLVEHFKETAGKLLITDMERVAYKLVVVFTTLGFIEQGPYDNNGEFNPFQEHRWGPKPEDFEGWQVDVHPDWHGPRGGAIFAYKFLQEAT